MEQKKNMWKQALTWFGILFAAFALMAVTGSRAEGDVAAYNGTNYKSLQLAIADVPENADTASTISLVGNASGEVEIPAGKNITIIVQDSASLSDATITNNGILSIQQDTQAETAWTDADVTAITDKIKNGENAVLTVNETRYDSTNLSSPEGEGEEGTDETTPVESEIPAGEESESTEEPVVDEGNSESNAQDEGETKVAANALRSAANELPVDDSYVKIEATNTAYSSIGTAISNATDGATITIGKSDGGEITIEESVEILEGKTITLDIGAGVTWTNKDDTHTIANYGTLTITGSGTVKNTVDKHAALMNFPGGNVTVKGCTFITKQEYVGEGNYPWYVIKNLGTMTFDPEKDEDLTVDATTTKSSAVVNGYYGPSNGPGKADTSGYANDCGLVAAKDTKVEMTINGGIFKGGLNTIKNDYYGYMEIKGGKVINDNTERGAVLNLQNLTITGGQFISNASQAVIWNYYNDAGAAGSPYAGLYGGDVKITIKGGEFGTEGQTSQNMLQSRWFYDEVQTAGNGGTVTISGGTFYGTMTPATNTYNIGGEYAFALNISGGTFAVNVDSKYIPEEYKLVPAGSYYTTEINTDVAVAKVVNGFAYRSVSEAIEAAGDGDTVQLLQKAAEDGSVVDREVTESLKVEKKITLDIPERVTLSGEADADVITNNGTLAISGSGKIYNQTAGKVCLLNNADCTATVAGVTIENTKGFAIKNLGILNIESGTYSGQGGTGTPANEVFDKTGTNAPTITGGTFSENVGNVDGYLDKAKFHAILNTSESACDVSAHEFTNYVSDDNATCQKDGTKTAVCDCIGCVATDTVTDVGSKADHKFTTYVSNNDATCTADGTKTAMCDYECGTESDPIPDVGSKKDHTYVEIENSREEAGCTTEGKISYECSECGLKKEEKIPALGHDWVKGAVTAPTCTEPGYTTYTCSRCGETKKDDYTLATGHSLGGDNVCDRCGYVEELPVYNVIEGANATWTQDSGVGLTIRADGALENFVYITIDGVRVDESNYTATSGSTIITLKPAYLDLIALGSHTLDIFFNDGGKTSTTFEVQAATYGASGDETGSGDTSYTDDTDGADSADGAADAGYSADADDSGEEDADDSEDASEAATPTDSGTKTGDAANPALWLVILSVSGICVAGSAFYGRKRKFTK